MKVSVRYYHEHWNSSNRLKGARIDNPVSVFMVWSLRGKMDEFTLAILLLILSPATQQLMWIVYRVSRGFQVMKHNISCIVQPYDAH
ncbi:unnamed protein product [Lactuca virosa]|uniref:Uncharacterized protein n=1 Tax=Lactuca virosa TaxID=75947 RepID=A0AAU9N2G1_9ASTR|nr:unnamed protein product [Lactuca virosa]